MKGSTAEKDSQPLDIRELSELDQAFELADSIVTKNYLSRLEQYALVETDPAFDRRPVYEHASLFRVKKLVYDRNENNLQKLINTYASSAGSNSSIAMLLYSDGTEIELYLGTTGASEISSARASAKALCQDFYGNFPGSLGRFNDIALDNSLLETLMTDCTKDLFTSVSCVSGIGSPREKDDVDNANYIQGIEKMIDSMQGTPFSAFLIADLIDKAELQDIKAEYEVLYSRLVPFLKSELSFNESSSDSVSKTLSESLSRTLTTSRSSALSVGTNKSHAHTEGHSTTNTDTLSFTLGGRTGVKIPIASASTSLSLSGGYSHSLSRTKSWSDTATFGTTKNQTSTIGDSEAKGQISSTADGTSRTETTGRSLQITYINKTIQQLLDQIDEQLERIKEGENHGVFAFAAYFLAATPMAARMAASAYKGLINGSCTHIEAANINSWEDPYNVEQIKKYLRKLHHPVFALDGSDRISPASVVSSRELAVQMGMPRKSLPGVSVVETAAFGRNIERDTTKARRYISLGNLYHMGRDEESANGKIPVRLDLDSLSMHTFITGSTGSGKSNAIYSLLESVLEKNEDLAENQISFMVIEPAKGEYKDKFGHRKDVRVLGTNPKKTELLQIDPFSFPEDIHVLEHIDRLIEIFNVCWPMYAAMPAVLKDAVERAYINAGWDLRRSICKYKSEDGILLYPCFSDVLQQVHVVMEGSSYSADSKGDYTGALCTRLRSLTNGLYGQIFSPSGPSPEGLFDHNVIIDLSRVGSTETKALIMGLLVMKMQEYRIATHHENDSGLRHLTILEEAHNLLKKTSTEQSSDSSNLLGRSVEMLANSIAEMRTYGEGFVIADQAPGALDMAVIRNTNTKIILRLPDISDRGLVGRAAALNDDQIIELSRLKTGVAAVYQNGWLEPVLCHISPCKEDAKSYIYKNKSAAKEHSDMEKLLDHLMLPASKKLELDTDKIKELERSVYRSQLASDIKVRILKYITAQDLEDETLQKMRNKIIYRIFNSETALALSAPEKHDISSWYTIMQEKLEPDISSLDRATQDKILAIIAIEQAEQNKDRDSSDLFSKLMTYIENNRRVMNI